MNMLHICILAFKLAGFIACSTNHYQTSHTYGIMHMYKYHYYTQYNFLFPFFNLGTPFFMYQFLSFSQTSTTWTLYRRILRTLSSHTTEPTWAYLNWYNAPTSSNFPCGKTWVRCIHWDGRPYPNPPRVRWHSTFKAETLCYQYQWMASGIRSLRVSNCQKATSLCSWSHGIPASDSGSRQQVPQWLLIGIQLMLLAASHFSVQL